MSDNNRVCKVCQEAYRYCPDCYEDSRLETWHIMFDEENCKNIFLICLNDFHKSTTREQTINLLSHCDLSHLDSFESDINAQIKNILGLTEDEIFTVPLIEPVVIDTTEFASVDEELVGADVPSSTKFFGKKKKKIILNSDN